MTVIASILRACAPPPEFRNAYILIDGIRHMCATLDGTWSHHGHVFTPDGGEPQPVKFKKPSVRKRADENRAASTAGAEAAKANPVSGDDWDAFCEGWKSDG